MIAGIDIDAKGSAAYGDHERRLTEMPVLALVPCAPETRWHRALAARASRILCPTRRIAYLAPEGVTDSGSPPGTTWCLVVGDRPATPELHYVDCSPEGVLL